MKNVAKTILNPSNATVVALLLLVFMGGLMLYEARADTTTFDESAHIGAGYSYVEKLDYRLNPEHPPLLKMISGVPLLFMDLNFPDDAEVWEGVNEQWVIGDQFLHFSGNNPVAITFWARVGLILLALALGGFIYKWTKKLYNTRAALFALALFAFSPAFIANGHYVTTDVGAAFGFVVSTFFLFKYLKNQTRKNLILAGVAFGIAQLIKFSLILLLPFFTVIAILWVFFREKPRKLISKESGGLLLKYLGKLILIGLIGLIVIYPFYQIAVLNYPAAKQVNDTAALLAPSPVPPLADAAVWMADKPVLRAFGHFFTGHLMVLQRVSFGNTVYYMGQVTSEAFLSYFPVVFALKAPTALLVMFLVAFVFLIRSTREKLKLHTKRLVKLKDKITKTRELASRFISEHIVEVSLAFFVFMYWLSSIFSNLNIGLRHVLPTFPFIYILLAGIMRHWIHQRKKEGFGKIKVLLGSILSRWAKIVVISLLTVWYALGSLSVFPHHIAYFNALAGGPEEGHKYVVDSNLDWGQDLRRLADFVEKNNIENIKLHYFGGGNPEYYLGEKYEYFDPFKTERSGWIAVSATLLQGGRGKAVKGFDQSTTHFMWLNKHKPVEVIGHSIFVYNID